MRFVHWLGALAIGASSSAMAQQPDSTTRADSAARADSIARADSLLLVRELERIRGEPRARPMVPTASPGTGSGPSNPTLLPNISAIGDFVTDLSPRGSTQEDGKRFSPREVEVAIQAAVDPYFRGDFILGVSDLEGISIEEAYLSTTALPWQSQVRLGRFHMPFGKQNTTHRAELHTIEYPYVIQRFLGPEGGKGTGVWFSRILAPFGFYQELQATVVDHLGEEDESLRTAEPVNKQLAGLGYSARFRNYWDLGQAANVELSASGMTGRRAQPFEPPLDPELPNAIAARQSVLGVDLTYRWRPLEQGLYKSFIVQAEAMRQVNERRADVTGAPPGTTSEYLGPRRDFDGAYVFGRYQMGRRWHLGSRLDWLEDPEADGERLTAASGFLEIFPSEFSKFHFTFERVMPGDPAARSINRLLVQVTFAVGPHRPHPF